ncbi:alpha/beta hydrolase family protein [Halopolyspora algeriensis]|uniref:Alpha/beta hydrolase family protein n=1 Tax=Halopolyspora algeriensis TaxID=1500506 RepID=A0A368VH14_9ACTN|nr:alpha/beta hydrolase [Halopolyspora algeriensis]RCW40679.1 alpha/beta hydrolase family protein [Halopolyspora algeriensis]TQM53398.1 alpha/beta hydrolase family protein [Halopolyspora algeriensis]
MPRLLTAIAALLLLFGFTAACTPEPEGSQGLQPHTERNGPAGTVPPGLGEYYGQALEWGPCAEYATSNRTRAAFRKGSVECARLTVPLDYSDPQGRTITLGVLRKPASDPTRRIGSLVVNPGGPGASGMLMAAGLAGPISSTELGTRFDLVGFDPRGIGASEPRVNCLTDAERDAERLDSDADTSPAGIAQTERENRAYAAKCAQRSGTELLANVGTRDVAKDMDVLRSALGDTKLTYLGFSYGTRIGAEYAEQFPGNVRAMVLDGAIDPDQSKVAELVAQGAGFQQAFDKFAAWCSRQDNCALGNDPARAVSVYQQLTRPLVEQPIDAGAGRKLSYSDATTGTIQALYSERLWGQLNTGLLQLAQGRGQALKALADAYYGRGKNGSYSGTTDAFDAVRCVDDRRLTDRARLREADRRYRQAAPFLDNGHPPSGARGVCAFWPVPVTADDRDPEAAKLPTTLVISTTGDPATPYEAGAELADTLGARLLTFEGTQHTVFLQDNACVNEAGIRYLVTLEPPQEGTRCTS